MSSPLCRINHWTGSRSPAEASSHKEFVVYGGVLSLGPWKWMKNFCIPSNDFACPTQDQVYASLPRRTAAAAVLPHERQQCPRSPGPNPTPAARRRRSRLPSMAMTTRGKRRTSMTIHEKYCTFDAQSSITISTLLSI